MLLQAAWGREDGWKPGEMMEEKVLLFRFVSSSTCTTRGTTSVQAYEVLQER